jgi:O-antigen/teichoic acid export membrane protein
MNQTWTKYLPSFLQQKLEGRHVLQRAVGNTGWLFADQIIRMVVALLVGVWVARYLGPAQYGALSYVLAFVSLFSPLVTLGLDSIVVRNIVRDPDNKEKILGSAFALKLAGGVATFLLSGSLIFFLHPKDSLTHWLVWIIAAGTIFQAFDTIDFWFQSQMQAKYTVYARNASCIVVALIKVGLILSAAPLIAFAWAGLAEIILGAVGLVIAYKIRGFSLATWKASYQQVKGLLKDSWPLILSGIAIYVQARIDQVMLGDWIGNAEVGQYSVAMRLIEVFGFIPMVIHMSAGPVVTEAKVIGEEFYYNRLLNLYRIMFILFVVTALPIFAFSDKIIIFVFGSQYREAGVLLSLFAVRLFFTNMGIAKNLFITNENLFRYAMITAIIGSLFNLVLNYLLIPKYAAIGAIWAMIISFSVTIFFVDVFFTSLRKNLIIMIKAVLTPWKVRLV